MLAATSRLPDAPARYRLWPRLLAALALAAALAGPSRAEVAVTVTADPPLPVQNLVQNPGFEAGADLPEGWSISSGMPELFTFRRLPTGGRTGACLQVDGLSSRMSGYLAQHLRVKPDTRYLAGSWLRIRGGHCLVWLLSYVAGQRWDVYIHKASWGGCPLVPDFIPLSYTDSPPPDRWIWVGQEFTTAPGQTNLNFHVGSYFERGSMDFDDAFLGLAKTTLHIQAGGEALAGVVVKDEAGKECYSSGPLAAGTITFDREVRDLPTNTRYQVVVRTAGGKEVARWYP